MFYVGESSVLEVDGTLKSNFLGVVFDTCLGSGLEDDILMEFDDFGLHLGVPGETILGFAILFWGICKKVPHMVRNLQRFWEGSAAVGGSMLALKILQELVV